MSSLAIPARSAAALPNVSLQFHHHGAHGARPDLESVPSIGQPGQLPAAVGQGLIKGAVQSLQGSVGTAPGRMGANVDTQA